MSNGDGTFLAALWARSDGSYLSDNTSAIAIPPGARLRLVRNENIRHGGDASYLLYLFAEPDEQQQPPMRRAEADPQPVEREQQQPAPDDSDFPW